MRHLFLTSLLCLLTTPLFSQIEKGAYQVGGNINITRTDGLNANTGIFRRTSLSTRGGIFVNDKISTGISLSYTYTDQGSGRYGHGFNYGVYGRWHKPVLDELYFFIRLSAGLTSGRANIITTDTVSKSSGYFISTGPGLIYFLSERIGLELTAGSIFFRHTDSLEPFNRKENTYGIDLGLSGLSLGASIYF